MQSEAKRAQVLSIEGMSCENCVEHVTRALIGLNGVETAQVSLVTNRAAVIYDPKLVDLPKMITAVEDEGYRAIPT
jgi:copper chaperone CopZ